MNFLRIYTVVWAEDQRVDIFYSVSLNNDVLVKIFKSVTFLGYEVLAERTRSLDLSVKSPFSTLNYQVISELKCLNSPLPYIGKIIMSCRPIILNKPLSKYS